jgi:microcystin-dependent protein
MPSTFTDNTGIEKLGDGEQTGLWGQTTNANFDIVDRALNGVLPIQLLSTSFTLTTSSGGLSDGQASAVLFTGSIGGPATITVSPNTAQKTYLVRNESNQPLVITQGSGGNVTIPVGKAIAVACTGEGATARVFQVGLAEINFASGVLGTLPIANGGTGTTSTQFASLTTNVTGTLPIANGGTGTTSTQFASLTTNVTGVLPVPNGGTGRSTITSGAIVLGSGTGQVGQLVGTGVGQIPRWDGTTWTASALPDSGVLNVTASTPLASSGGASPDISLTGTVPIANGGTGTSSTQFTNLTTNVTDTLPVANGGTGRSTLSSGALVLGNGTGVVGQLTGTTAGQVAQWTGSTWAAATPPAGMPSGGIIMWSGSIASIPSGWFLCNGSNGTPDLRNRFIVGAGSSYGVGVTGGADSVTLATSQIPSHSHSFSGTTNTTGAHQHNVPHEGGSATAGPNLAGSSQTPNFNTLTDVQGNHAHTFSGTTSSVGSNGAHENRPPYYALAYIMKS